MSPTCPTCGDDFSSEGSAREHAWEAHGACHLCGDEFDDRQNLSVHWLAIHDAELSEPDRQRAEQDVGPLTFGDRLRHQGAVAALAATNWKSHLFGGVVGLVAVLLVVQLMGGGLGGSVLGTADTPYDKQRAQTGLDVGTQAPDFTLETTDGDTVSLHASDKPTVVFFMASWCSSCRLEENNLQKIHRKYGDSVRLITVDVDPERDTMGDLRRFKSKYGGDWVHAMGTNAFIQRYQIKALDTTYVLNEHGVIVHEDHQITTAATLDEQLSRLTDRQAGGMPADRFGDVGSVHRHANLSVSVHGERVNLSKQTYMVQSRYVHLEGGDGTTIHAHATGVTLAYFFETIDWELTNECLRTDTGESHCTGDGGTLDIVVNGEEIDDPQYVLQDGDRIRVVYE